jgi:hypothetical protein
MSIGVRALLPSYRKYSTTSNPRELDYFETHWEIEKMFGFLTSKGRILSALPRL